MFAYYYIGFVFLLLEETFTAMAHLDNKKTSCILGFISDSKITRQKFFSTSKLRILTCYLETNRIFPSGICYLRPLQTSSKYVYHGNNIFSSFCLVPNLFEGFFLKVTADEKVSFHQKEFLENVKLVFKVNQYLFTHNEGPIIHITLSLKT